MGGNLVEGRELSGLGYGKMNGLEIMAFSSQLLSWPGNMILHIPHILDFMVMER